MSKQSNEINQTICDDSDDDVKRSQTWRGKGRADFNTAKLHAEELGLSDKVSDATRRMMTRYRTSPLKFMMDALADPGRAQTDKAWAAEKLLPYLHSKADAIAEDAGAKGKAKRPILNVTKTYKTDPPAKPSQPAPIAPEPAPKPVEPPAKKAKPASKPKAAPLRVKPTTRAAKKAKPKVFRLPVKTR